MQRRQQVVSGIIILVEAGISLFRDIHAMSSHFLLQPEPIAEAYGRLLLGLELTPGTRL